jgi:RNA 2',3'-cyclic 3'-phosphodiesterase
MLQTMTQGKNMRVFFALWPDQAGRTSLAAWQAPLRKLCGGRAMRSETLHNTLAFLGNVLVHRLEALKLAAREVQGASFDLCLDKAHYWGHNHIVYAAPDNIPAQLLQLAHGLELQLRRHHFDYDRREYKPHVTLLRNAGWSDAPLPHLQPVTWRVRDFVLVQSLTDETGARYQVLARFPLEKA